MTRSLISRSRRLAATLAVMCAAIGRATEAQQPSGRPPVPERPRALLAPPRAIVGIVADTANVPIDSVEVRIASLQRRTVSDANGHFRFDGVKPGAYEVRTRRLGFAPQVKRVTVGNERGGSVTFALVPVRYVLPPVVTSSPRGGLSGVIGDTAFNVIRGAEVYVVGSGERTLTDSAGTFFLNVKPGSYMVEVTSRGFGRKLLSVTVPRDSGRHVTVWLTRDTGPTAAREAFAIDALRYRLMLRGATARLFTREDMSRYNMQWLSQLVLMGSGMPISDQCDAVVNGFWRTPVYALTVDELESVEVYPPGSLPSAEGSRLRTTLPRSIDPRGTQRRPSGPRCPAVFVWTRD
jgi:hypothetical protein